MRKEGGDSKEGGERKNFKGKRKKGRDPQSKQ